MTVPIRSDSRYRVDLCDRALLGEFCAAGASTRSLEGLFVIACERRLEAWTRAPLEGPRVMADSFRFLLAGGIGKFANSYIDFVCKFTRGTLSCEPTVHRVLQGGRFGLY